MWPSINNNNIIRIFNEVADFNIHISRLWLSKPFYIVKIREHIFIGSSLVWPAKYNVHFIICIISVNEFNARNIISSIDNVDACVSTTFVMYKIHYSYFVFISQKCTKMYDYDFILMMILYKGWSSVNSCWYLYYNNIIQIIQMDLI